MRKFWIEILLSVTIAGLMASCTVEDTAQIIGIGWTKYTLDIDEISDVKPIGDFSLTVTSMADGANYTWSNIDDYSLYESLHVGSYMARVVSGEEGAEGYGCQCYVGEAEFDISEGTLVQTTINAKLSQARIYVNVSDKMLAAYPECGVAVHAIGGNYNDVKLSTTSPLLAIPGITYLYIAINHNGEKVTISPQMEIDTQAAQAYNFEIGLDGETMTLTYGTQTTSIQLNDSLFDSQAPVVSTSGFASGQTVSLFEGFPSAQSLIMNIDAPAGIKAVVLTIGGTSDVTEGMPTECDLLNVPESLLIAGLGVDKDSDTVMRVDFTSFLERLSINADSEIWFLVHVVDILNRASDVAILNVKIVNLEATLVGQTAAPLNTNYATVTLSLNSLNIEQQDFTVYLLDSNGNEQSQAELITWDKDEANSRLTLGFNIGEGYASVPVRIDYMDKAKVLTTIERTVPEYTIEADAYATHALIQVISTDSELVNAIVKYGRPYSGTKALTVSARDASNGALIVSGLEAAHNYQLTMQVVEGAYSPTVSFTTEKALSVPEGDFEDVVESIDYNGLAMGGTYSNTVFPIYNMQNRTNINVWWPQKYWASVNAKTFSSAAKNQNTWYMQPSSVIDFDNFASGSKCIRLTSVGWSIDGAEIIPYVQDVDKHLSYNANIPEQEHAAAGKLFLGQYKFEASSQTELYDEGVSFESRPSSLNGYYKYTSVRGINGDAGLVELYLINDESTNPIIIGSARMEFDEVADFVTFNLPIEYSKVGIKATRLKMMFSSSKGAGPIEYEDVNVPIAPDVENSVYIGSTLWIDNLTFSY